MILALIKGLIAGFSVAAPIGPVNLIFIERALTKSKLSAIITGLGAATADTFYAAVAAFGLRSVSGIFISHERTFATISAIFMIAMGIRIVFFTKSIPIEDLSQKLSRIKQREKKFNTPKNLIEDYVSSFFFTITNPMTIVTFTLILAALGIGFKNSVATYPVFIVVGVFLGSMLWWFILLKISKLIERKLNEGFMDDLARILGVFILIFGGYILLRVIAHLPAIHYFLSFIYRK